MPSMKGKYQPAGVGMIPSTNELGKFVRSRRMELDLRQIPVNRAAKFGSGNNIVSLIEVGKRKYLNSDQIEGLANVLMVDPDEIRKRMPEKPISKPTTEIGKLIRARREELGITLEDFAKKLKVTPQIAKNLEIRKTLKIRYNFVKPLAKVLKLEVSTFARFVGNERKVSSSELGRLIRDRRKELTMSMAMLAKKMNVSNQFISQIECGHCRLSQNDEIFERLAKVLSLDVEQLKSVRPQRRLKVLANPASPLGQFLASRRLELRLTQRQVGERAETTCVTISSVERGKICPTPDLLDRIARALECKIPQNLVPPLRRRKLRYSNQVDSKVLRVKPLGEFITRRRLELCLTQSVVAQRAKTSPGVISAVERGTYVAGDSLLERISKALLCDIPQELVPERKRRKNDDDLGRMVKVSGQALLDLKKIKEIAGVNNSSDVVRKAVQLLYRMLEKQQNGYVISIVRGDEVVKLEIFL